MATLKSNKKTSKTIPLKIENTKSKRTSKAKTKTTKSSLKTTEPKKQGGRPKLQDGEKKRYSCMIYLNKEQKQILEQKARKSNLPVSSYIIVRLFGIEVD